MRKQVWLLEMASITPGKFETVHHRAAAGRGLVTHGRERKQPQPRRVVSRGDASFGVLLLAVRRLSLDHIRNIAGARRRSLPREVLRAEEPAPLLKSHLAALLRVGPGPERDELFEAIDILAEVGGGPRRINVAVAGPAKWTAK
jgi:hypothetical protein